MKLDSKKLRAATAAALIVAIAVGFATNLGIGTLSAPGFWDISILCPLGALGTMLAAKAAVPRAVVSLVVMTLLIVVFARAFCAWMCPIPLVQKVRTRLSRKRPSKDVVSDQLLSDSLGQTSETENLPSSEKALARASAVAPGCPGTGSGCSESKDEGCSSCPAKRGSVPDARHFVLGGALLSTLAFGFPVFCLVCPIGLTFATVLLVINLFAHGDVTWSLVVVPLMLAAEVLLFRKWCHRLCPLSAFMSLIAKANRTFVPTVDDGACLETTKGVACGICGKACGEGIDPRHPQLSQASWSECTKCRACVEACPTQAIAMPLLPKRRDFRRNPDVCRKGLRSEGAAGVAKIKDMAPSNASTWRGGEEPTSEERER